MEYFKNSFEGELIIINSRLIKSDKELIMAFHRYDNSPNAIMIGHTHQPSLANRKLVINFWSSIYKISDIRLTILRNPMERSISWIKAAGNLSLNDDSEHGIPFRFKGLNQKSLKVAEKIEFTRGNRSSLCDNIYSCILPDNFYADSPDNTNIAMSLNNYPIELLSSINPNYFLTPLPLRSQTQVNAYNNLFISGLEFNSLRQYLEIPEYEYYALENINHLVNRLEIDGITKPGFHVPHINSIEADPQISLVLRTKLTNLYPESFLLWKHSANIF
ncbi:hypothetical protein PMIT1318_01877 [Prochlorococcus marinus str. MIT 1318]|uniref:hypothetical protein n=1 Tax=Prochlorococcus TaxID=1218 RepID=UPI0007B3B01B|nr:hypothetical protein [Prochlorococcus marinus]KZR70737.1 hypothetical protein PMIT1318_01877 [Prochlorococcus marinus str. MIT 1318]